MAKRNRLAVLVAIGASLLIWLVPATGARAAGTWSAPEQLDTAAAHTVGVVLVSCPAAGLCIGSSDYTNGPVAFTGQSAALEMQLTIPAGSGDNEVALPALQCPSASLCVGVADDISGDSGNAGAHLVVSTAPAGGQDAWVQQHLSVDIPLELSCPTTAFCAGANASGVLTSENPAGGAKTWTQTPVGASGLVDVDCPSASFCAAFDAKGAIWTSSNPSGPTGAWQRSGATPLAVAGKDFSDGDDDVGAGAGTVIPQALSCAGPNLCLATDGNTSASKSAGVVLVSTDPASASAWTPVSVSSAAITAVYCEPATTLCLAGDADGNIAASDDGGLTWATLPSGQDEAIDELSCVGAECAAADGDVPVLATVPAGGVPTSWTPLTVTVHNPLASISCPGAGECIGADPLINYQNQSRYFFSSDPAAGAGSWRHVAVTRVPGRNGGGTLSSSCFSATGCLAVFSSRPNAGRRGGLYSFDPVDGPHAFRSLGVGGQYGALDTTCAQGTCVAGYPGHWFSSGDPGDARAWRAVGDPRFDVTCLSGNRSCIALAAGPFLGAAGHDLLVAARRGGPWRAENVDPDGYLDGLACTSAKACVLVDEGGRLLVSTNPTSGVGSWQLSDTDFNGFDGVACESARSCVVVAADGSVITGRP